jgi:tetratricopeptide (TPR) repeat protein
VRTLPEAEAEVLQGSLLMRVGRGEQAEPYFTRARALDPDAPRLEESLGFLSLNRGQYEEAVAHLERAIQQDPANPLAHYYYAETLRRQVMEQGRPLPAEVARAMAEPLRRAIALRPAFARAYYLLGYAHLVTGDDLSEGMRLLRTAIDLVPPYRAAALTLASIQLKMRDYAAAKATAQAILDAPDAAADIKADAARVLATANANLRRP